MIKFSPEASLLQSIECKERFPIILLVPGYEQMKDYEGFPDIKTYASSVMVRSLLTEAYKVRFHGFHTQKILVHMVSEQNRNCAEHGNKDSEEKYFTLAIWLGEKGVLFAYRDEGNYFSLPETKKAFESRTAIPSTRVRKEGRGHGGNGTQYLYSVADRIVVSTEENTLYATYLL